MTAPISAADLGVPLTPSKPAQLGVVRTGSQRDRRFTDTFFDVYKHPVKFPGGRPFCGEREFTSGTDRESITAAFITSDLQLGQYFCENPEQGQTPQERLDSLASAWTCPWIPLAKYFRFNYRHKRITYALDKMVSDEREALNRYWDAAAKAAGENDIVDDQRPKAIPFRIKRLLGVPEQYTNQIKLAQAMQAGDPWLLGFSNTPNEELAKILGYKVQYVGGHAADSEYVTTKLPDAPKPIATPEQVLGMDMMALQKMIAETVAVSIAAHEQAKRDAKGKQLRDGKAKRSTAARSDAA
jgi:hypothetical protein